ncbi:MAG: dienelactone hydrolase family protein [Zoogloeaceae bacterium]|nr:dienelactone hydrolase family protein [Rhodocyclaceae bacterium]MCP5236923.1 dienelactone hydrolase family protein [Zoogloeaceae bacterium]
MPDFIRIGMAVAWLLLATGPAAADKDGGDCRLGSPTISFVEIPSVDLSTQPPGQLTIKAKLKYPAMPLSERLCRAGRNRLPAVVILHGSAGIDARGEFYAQALNAAGFVTLEIDMWEARDVEVLADRPGLPILTYPDAFAALAYLTALDDIDPSRIGVLGFSWGAAVSLASAEQLYAGIFGHGLRFAAHVANYPPCYAINNPAIPVLDPPAEKGSQFLVPTGAPVLIQIGSNDGYDNGPEHCEALRDTINAQWGDIMTVEVYDGAEHAFDRLMVPIEVLDPFADEGSAFRTGVVPTVTISPSVGHAYASRRAAVGFMRRHLSRARH